MINPENTFSRDNVRELDSVVTTCSLKLAKPIPLTQHPAAVYLAGLSEGSRPTMRWTLNAIAQLLTDGECDALALDWSKLRYQHTASVRVALMERYARATACKMLCALKRVLKEATRLGLLGIEDYLRAVDLPRLDLPPSGLRGRALASFEIVALMDACQPTVPAAIDIRDAALIAVLCCGLRRKEVVSLKLKDFAPNSGALSIHNSKRGAYRIVYLPPDAGAFVKDWIEVRGSEPGALFCPLYTSDKIKLRPMSADAVFRMVRKRGKEAGLDLFSPHDFRRTFCSDLLDAGVDIVTVAKLAGHSKTEITAKYDRRGEETKRQAMQKLSIPRKKRPTEV